MAQYNIHFVHPISSKPIPHDSVGPIEIRDGAFADSKTLAKALRQTRVLKSGERVRHFRVEDPDKVVAFPSGGTWHALIIEPTGGYVPLGVDYPGYHRLPSGRR